jgi:Zn-dependent peptidase ImmA (M78 family)
VSAGETLEFRLNWRDVVDGVEYKTLASISVLIDGTTIWPVAGEDGETFDWYVDELLSHLTECWKPLLLRQTYPIPIQPERPSLLRVEAERRWSGLPEAVVKEEESKVTAFEDVHNLVNAFGGVSGLPPLWLLRSNNDMIVDTRDEFRTVPFEAASAALNEAGTTIAKRLELIDCVKWARLLEAWQHRDVGDRTLLLALVTGLDRHSAQSLIESTEIEAPVSVSDAANDNDELRIAARMAGILRVSQIKEVLKHVSECPSSPAPQLDEAASEAAKFLRTVDMENRRPFAQGVNVARWLRNRLDLPPHLGADPIRVLQRYGVDVRTIHLEPRSLDAIAVWGPRHGPAVLLNQTSARTGLSTNYWRNGAVRVTAAHELCHLLVDHEHTLSAVEVLGGRMPLRVEQRAKAFAAEFLLPEQTAADAWQRAGSPYDAVGLRGVLKSLCSRFNVTMSVAAWKLEQGLEPYHREQIAPVLNDIAPQR